MHFKSSGVWITCYYGTGNGKLLNGELFGIHTTNFDCDKWLKFVYTNYLNVVVIFGNDSYIMVLWSNDTNMTYEQRMTLIQLKVRHLLDWNNLKKEGSMDDIKIGSNQSLMKPLLLIQRNSMRL